MGFFSVKLVYKTDTNHIFIFIVDENAHKQKMNFYLSNLNSFRRWEIGCLRQNENDEWVSRTDRGRQLYFSPAKSDTAKTTPIPLPRSNLTPPGYWKHGTLFPPARNIYRTPNYPPNFGNSSHLVRHLVSIIKLIYLIDNLISILPTSYLSLVYMSRSRCCITKQEFISGILYISIQHHFTEHVVICKVKLTVCKH